MTVVMFTLYIIALGLLPALRNTLYLFHVITVAACYLALNPQDELNYITPYSVIITLSIHLISINAATFILYRLDKKAAKDRMWRIPEKTLHAFALMGGTPAAFLARKVLRHKTAKRSFVIEFRLILILQFVFIISLLYVLKAFNI